MSNSDTAATGARLRVDLRCVLGVQDVYSTSNAVRFTQNSPAGGRVSLFSRVGKKSRANYDTRFEGGETPIFNPWGEGMPL